MSSGSITQRGVLAMLSIGSAATDPSKLVVSIEQFEYESLPRLSAHRTGYLRPRHPDQDFVEIESVPAVPYK